MDAAPDALCCSVCMENWSTEEPSAAVVAGAVNRMPRSLECGHSLCTSCLTNILVKQKHWSAECPECRHVTRVINSSGLSRAVAAKKIILNRALLDATRASEQQQKQQEEMRIQMEKQTEQMERMQQQIQRMQLEQEQKHQPKSCDQMLAESAKSLQDSLAPKAKQLRSAVKMLDQAADAKRLHRGQRNNMKHYWAI